MTRSRSELERVRDIREAIAAIWRYQAAVRRNPPLFPTGMLEQATMDNLMIIGEAANHLPEEIKVRARDIPWRRIVAFRNVVVHEYWYRDPGIITRIISRSLTRRSPKSNETSTLRADPDGSPSPGRLGLDGSAMLCSRWVYMAKTCKTSSWPPSSPDGGWNQLLGTRFAR